MMLLPGNALERQNLDSNSNINGRCISDFYFNNLLSRKSISCYHWLKGPSKEQMIYLYSPSSAEMNLSTGCKIGQNPQAQGLSAMS